MTKVVVSGAIANKPHNGGEAWVRLSWLLGLRRLGCDVILIEQLDAAGSGSWDESATSSEDSPAVKYFQLVARQFGLDDCASLITGAGEPIAGMAGAEVRRFVEGADVLINISGHLTAPDIKDAIRSKIYIDLDPGFTQFWQAQGTLGGRLKGHDYYYTVGENIGRDFCAIPTVGLDWRPVRQPVVLDQWPVVKTDDHTQFSTIASWRGAFGPIQDGGKIYGLKVHEFRKIIELPQLVDSTYELALDIDPTDEKDLQLLSKNGWRLVDPKQAAGDPLRFRTYVQQSAAEFSVAQGIYVDTLSGWFSDRTVRYLASGKPVLVQDTGFSRNLPVGEGLLTFTTLEQAVAGANAIAGDYDGHCRAARSVAEEYFDSDKVLSRLLEEIGVG
jgi:hypothetical protein